MDEHADRRDQCIADTLALLRHEREPWEAGIDPPEWWQSAADRPPTR